MGDTGRSSWAGPSASRRVGALAPRTDPTLFGSTPFQAPILVGSLAQLSTSFGGFIATCAAMYLCLAVSLWTVLPLSVLAAGFLVRIFIIQHDCGHGSFFRSRRANDLIGMLCSLMTLTPYAFWRRQHARHHGSWNNLDRRAASGLDIYSSCMTVAEYRALGRWRRGLVRCTHHPIVAHLLLPPVLFIVLYRTPFDRAKNWRRERHAIYLTNVALGMFFGGLGLILGYGQVAVVQLPIMVCASIVGVWLFSIQHRFEGALWTPEGSWTFNGAVLGSTSYLRLPRILQWFTGNIGFHHVHHVNPRIPNYRLEECHTANSEFQAASKLTLGDALRAVRYTLWDSDQERLVSFRSAIAS
jgi:acyl-lipid omega-6 desaturase (Delta-12 desaturase)